MLKWCIQQCSQEEQEGREKDSEEKEVALFNRPFRSPTKIKFFHHLMDSTGIISYFSFENSKHLKSHHRVIPQIVGKVVFSDFFLTFLLCPPKARNSMRIMHRWMGQKSTTPKRLLNCMCWQPEHISWAFKQLSDSQTSPAYLFACPDLGTPFVRGMILILVICTYDAVALVIL